MSRLFLPVIAVVIFISFFRLGSVTLFDVDEAVFAQATKEMMESGNWITPTFNGENRYDKPILFYWLVMISYKIFGINEFAARFTSALSSFLLALSVFFFVRYFHGERNGLYALIALVLSLYSFIYSHAAVTDMVLTLFISLAVFSFYISVKKNRRYIYGLYIFSALAFLTKGLIGIVFPFGVAVAYLLITEGLAGIKKIFHLGGVILFLIISLPWYIAQFAINGQEFFQQFFIKHHLKRYTGVIAGHRGPFYYYIPMLVIGMFPWIAFCPAGIRDGFREKDSPGLLAVIWLAGIVVFFSLSTTKLPNYILPAVPAASILIASGVSGQDKWRQYANIFIAVAAVLMGVAFLISRKYLTGFGFYDTGWTTAVAAIMFAMGIFSLYALLTKRTLYGYMSVFMIAFLFALSVKALPLASQYLQGTLHRYSLYARDRLHDNERIIAYGINNPSIVFYSGHKLVKAGSRDDLMPLMGSGEKLIIISKTKDVAILESLGFTLLERDARYAILERT